MKYISFCTFIKRYGLFNFNSSRHVIDFNIERLRRCVESVKQDGLVRERT